MIGDHWQIDIFVSSVKEVCINQWGFSVFLNVAFCWILFYSFCWNTPVELEFILSKLWKTERYSKFQSEANWPCYYRKRSETSENAELKKTQPKMKKENHPNQKTKPLFKHVSFWGSGLQCSISLQCQWPLKKWWSEKTDLLILK